MTDIVSKVTGEDSKTAMITVLYTTWTKIMHFNWILIYNFHLEIVKRATVQIET